MMTRSQQHFASFVLVTLLLLVMPLINGFPFTYPDTGTYLRSAFQGYVPYDRPYWYGVFLRITSGGGQNLWGPAVVQAMLTAFVVLRTLRLLAPAGILPHTLLVVVLVACTGIGWYAGQLMPDIFSGIGLLALLLLVLDRADRPMLIAYGALLVLAILVHASNLLFFTLTAALVLVAFRSIPMVRRRNAALLVLACWPLLLALNAAVTGKVQLGRGSHVFLTARLIDAGILQEWLDSTCPGSSGLCAYRHSLPATANDFLWRPESPLYAMGGWEAPPDDYQRVVRDALTEPVLLGRFVANSLNGTARQLVEWQLGSGFVGRDLHDTLDPVNYMVRHTMEPQYPAFLAARQSTGDGNEGWVRAMDKLFWPVMLISHLVFLILLWPSSKLTQAWRNAAALVLAALVFNALVCATFSMVAERFGSRMNWVVPMLVLAAGLQLWTTKDHGRALRS